MAVVLWIRFVICGTSFLERRGSRGVRAANCGMWQGVSECGRLKGREGFICVCWGKRGVRTYQFDDFDQHPVVGGIC